LDTVPVSAPRELIARYRSAFVRGDVETLVDCFQFPLQVVTVEGGQVSVSIGHSEDWPRVLEGLLGAYKRLGVHDAVVRALEVSEPIEALAVVRARWSLQRQDGVPVYDFTAVYTLARAERGFRIVAIAHDELPKLRAATGAP
jgi:hypothetical protein